MQQQQQQRPPSMAAATTILDETNTNFANIPPMPPPPGQTPNQNDTDALFADELNKLSLKERDEVLYDVHGVADVVEETPDMIENAVQQMAYVLQQIPVEEKHAYGIALSQDSNYVTDRKLWTMFLRADHFRPQQAAVRLVAFFQMKYELFPIEALARDVKLSDLDDDDLRTLESGYAQIGNQRDRAGRAIFLLMPTIKKNKTYENKLRAIYLVLMFAMRDEETQKRGVVGIPYNVGRDHTKDREAVWKAAKLVSILPVRFTGIHYCFSDEKVQLLFSLAMFVFNKNARIRCRLHMGTHMECIYKLMTFGIPGDVIPVAHSGVKKLEAHIEFMQMMRKAEALPPNGHDNVNHIILPGKYDVLLGRGKPLQKHTGNLNYHCVVECYHEDYERALKLEKTKLAAKIVEQIHNQGGRFLKQDDFGSWVEIDEEAARTKISHTFRNHRIAARTALKKEQQQQKQKQQQASAAAAFESVFPSSASNDFFGSSLGGRFSPGMVLDPTVDSKRRRVTGANLTG
eukprot:CAMPEP_0113468778 /NCGR_PEP_ID=MMETSP0014_2-20120614/15539_1 /TAXON_ID=2857 /ORGANISM="Nitzschia sp." /LENGTH=515 /DNA_ID=CAMNT_0000361195 /DNA_START=365 /DNA_END=1912 /DNA_ORIENTATION=- /assembly_acc=CAM_ASM_000159